ncbi:unnamed protein product [Closterium sp. NIES-53]
MGSLTALTIHDCWYVKLPRFDDIVALKLRHVTIESFESGGSLESLSHLTSLERLEVTYVEGNEPFRVGLFALPSLTFVELGSVKWLEGPDLGPFWRPNNRRSPTAIYNEAAEIAAAEMEPYPPLGPSLRHLDISLGESEDSGQRFMSAGVCSLEWLTHLTISRLHSSALLPIALGQLRNLRLLSLSGRFYYFPPSLSLLATSLQSLTLHFTSQFSHIYCNYKCLPSLPASVADLTSLTYVDLTNFQLHSPTPDLARLALLSTLCVDYDFVDRFRNRPDLPTVINCLEKVETLELGESIWMVGLPPSFCKLPSLKKLRLSCTCLKQLPAKF